ncbi:MAG: glycoside hydrolase family 3 C-terminal domain-containing protein [Clostridia bacterium]|nr:glycoside hydrolase family 3 C-terminal domain-containing protein [Clostridia bacterium]
MNRKEARALAEKLVAQMTLEEKASQLRFDAPAIPRLGIPAYNWWNEALHGVARAGTATVFPQAIALAAIFDEDFHREVASTISTEARAKYNAQSSHGDRDIYKGLTLWSPNINIFRDPRWGRGHETYGEDPYLTSRLGVAFIRGLQGDGEYLKTAACAKHFAVHSGPEAIRHSFDATASKKDMAETYLPAFKAAVMEAHVETVMGAYNRVNGEPACGSKTLLKDILRDAWGFEGHVTSDCWAIRDFHENHHVTDTAPESAAMALLNGCDLNCGNTYLHMLQAVQEGLVTEENIAESAIRLFTTRYLLGLFDETCSWNTVPYSEVDTDEHNALAEKAAEKSMVLLKNNGLLPLDAGKLKAVAVVGPMAASDLVLKGNYYGTAARSVTLLEGIRAYLEPFGVRVYYSAGCDRVINRQENLAQPDDRLAEAAICAEQADVVIACVGLDETLEGEEGDTGNFSASGDKVSLSLPESQQRLMKTLAATGKPLVTVLTVGSSLNVPEGDAQLLAWYPGQAGGTALARILFGEVSPSGCLPVTFYKGLEDLPEFTDYAMTNRTYRYFTGEPLYPFGYGLSYTRFAPEALSVEGDHVTLTVRNTGKMDAETVAQVYVKPVENADAPVNPVLAGFARAFIAAGESKEISVRLNPDAFTVVNDAGERVVPGSDWDIWAGLHQPDALSEKLAGNKCLHQRIAVG